MRKENDHEPFIDYNLTCQQEKKKVSDVAEFKENL